ncbi:MAG: hypothetical protein KDA41_08215, partial [Planctomycetales bacterium]|nr:hypothetical protein [Planctomycetales bacterium]
YIRSAVEAAVQRRLAQGEKLPVAALETFVTTQDNHPRARRFAYELLLGADPTAGDRLLPKMLHDADVDLRRDAVARLLEDKTKASYERAFAAAVDDDQVKAIAAWLKEQGEQVDIARHYGYVMDWHLVGPFDNKDEAGYAVSRGPEGQPVDLTAAFPASHEQGTAKWTPFVTSDTYGKVDLNEVLGKYKGAICYAVTFFDAAEERDVQFRFSSMNACKLYLNGQLIDAHEVYHAGKSLDQYISTGRLQKGKNTILLKVCQNEQTESWAQDWGFQLRVCDAAGAAVLAQGR